MADLSSITTIIPAAGHSARFQAAGYTTPKPLMQVRYGGVDRQMYQHVMDRLPAPMAAPQRVYLGLPGMSRWMGDVRCGEIRRTMGQADTICQMLENLSITSPVLIHNCDVLLPMTCIEDMVARLLDRPSLQFVVAVQQSWSPAMSYVDNIAAPHFFAEKRCISEWAMAGAWAFRDTMALRRALDYTRSTVREFGIDPYLSHALNKLEGERSCVVIPSEKIVDWGTPQALADSGAQILED